MAEYIDNNHGSSRVKSYIHAFFQLDFKNVADQPFLKHCFLTIFGGLFGFFAF